MGTFRGFVNKTFFFDAVNVTEAFNQFVQAVCGGESVFLRQLISINYAST